MSLTLARISANFTFGIKLLHGIQFRKTVVYNSHLH